MVVFGDLIVEEMAEESANCINNIITTTAEINKPYKIHFEFDCAKGKMTAARWEKISTGEALSMVFENIMSYKSIKYPSRIIIVSEENNMRLDINIERIDRADNPSMKFVAGKNYYLKTLR